MKLERITIFKPAWDKRNDTDPKKDFGIGCASCIMVVKNEKGATHFSFGTGMMLERTIQEYARDGRLVHDMGGGRYLVLNAPMGYDVGYHSPTPKFEGHTINWPTKMRKTGEGPMDVAFDKIGTEPPKCDWIGVPCYCDGSAIRAEEWMKILLEEGSEKIWEMLEEEHKALFS